MVSIIKVLRTNNVPIVNKCFPARYVKKNKRYEPFPNLYWLDHQKLDLMISNLERIGVINDLEDRLNNDNVAMKLFMNQHLRYVHQRNKLFYDDELKLKLDLNINDENIKWLHDNLRQKGIGGIDINNLFLMMNNTFLNSNNNNNNNNNIEYDGKIDGILHIKCLHTHYAHYLYTKDNIVGEWVDDIINS